MDERTVRVSTSVRVVAHTHHSNSNRFRDSNRFSSRARTRNRTRTGNRSRARHRNNRRRNCSSNLDSCGRGSRHGNRNRASDRGRDRARYSKSTQHRDRDRDRQHKPTSARNRDSNRKLNMFNSPVPRPQACDNWAARWRKRRLDRWAEPSTSDRESASGDPI